MKRKQKNQKSGTVARRNSECNNSLDKDVMGLFDKVSAFSFREGHSMLMQLSGIGVLRPNVIVIGFKDD